MFRVQSGGRMIRKERERDKKDHTPVPAEPTPSASVTASKVTHPTHSEPSPSRPVPKPAAPRAAPDQATAPSRPLRPGGLPDHIQHVTPEEARQMFKRGNVPHSLSIQGPLNLSGSAWLTHLPDWLRCTALIVDDCINLNCLPGDLHAEKLSARRTPQLRELEGRISVRESINLTGSGIQRLRADLHATRLNLANCRELTELSGLISVAHLDVRGCAALTDLPPGLHVTQTLDVADSGLTGVPAHIHAGLRWNGVPIEEKIAFHPETLTGREIMQVSNVQRRRVLLERIGIERFLTDVGGLILDKDQDAGGERQLVKVPFNDDEDLVAVVVRCPSTGGQYALRVPPHTRTCREAVAWMAGMSVKDYHPTQEA